jgi:hypothetical protein
MNRGNINRLVLPLAVAVIVAGCSAESAKRAGFETMQSYRQLQCDKDPSSQCPQRERYEDYQKERKKIKDSE